jgi:ribonuclease HIII
VAYKTGKLVHNGSDETKRLLDQIMTREGEFDYVVGTDETGKGEWYGPLVVVGVALTPKDIVALRKMGIQDSKNLSKDRIQELGKYIRMSSLIFDSRVLKPQSYNKMYEKFKKEGKTLNDILAWAHTAIINDILQKIAFNKAKVVIDKFDIKATDLRLGKVKKLGVQVIQKSRGESETRVAAASILAKLLYEDEVDFLDKKYGLDLRRSKPEEIAKVILEYVGKTHFKNVSEALKKD